MQNFYEVIVSNIGTVHQGSNIKVAYRCFHEYKKQSINGYGRASGEDISFWINNDIKKEHFGTITESD